MQDRVVSEVPIYVGPRRASLEVRQGIRNILDALILWNEYGGCCRDSFHKEMGEAEEQPMPYRVGCSAAGYYVGQWCPVCGPHYRATDYLATKEEADSFLTQWLGGALQHYHEEAERKPTTVAPMFEHAIDYLRKTDWDVFGVQVELGNDGKCLIHALLYSIEDLEYSFVRISRAKDNPTAEELANFGSVVMREFDIPVSYIHSALKDSQEGPRWPEGVLGD